MIINRIKNIIETKQKQNVKDEENNKINKKSKTKDSKKKLLLTLSCLAAAGYLLIHNTKADNLQKPNMPSDNPVKGKGNKPDASETITKDESDYNSDEIADCDNDEPKIDPGYDGLTKVLLAIGVDGNIYEIYELSDGRLIYPADYHFPRGRSINELAFDREHHDYGILGVSKPISSNYGNNNSVADDIYTFDAKKGYKETLLHEIEKLPTGQNLLKELYSPEHEELYDAIFSTENISRLNLEAIYYKEMSSEGILLIILKRLSEYKEKHAEDSTNSQLIASLQSSIQERLQSIQEERDVIEENGTETEEDEDEAEYQYGYDDETEFEYY